MNFIRQNGLIVLLHERKRVHRLQKYRVVETIALISTQNVAVARIFRIEDPHRIRPANADPPRPSMMDDRALSQSMGSAPSRVCRGRDIT